MNIDQTAPLLYIGRLSSQTASSSSLSGNSPPVNGNSVAQPPSPALDIVGELTMRTLGEIETPAPMVEDAYSSDGGTVVLASESGSGSLNVKMAASIYVLNHSFDEQKGVLELIA